MTKKTSPQIAPRTAIVVDAGATNTAPMTSKAPAVSKSGLVPPGKPGTAPRDYWGQVSKEDIGAGFEVVETTTEKSIRDKNEREDPIWKNKFIKGSSPMIWYIVRPRIVKPKKKKVKEPINFKSKLDKKTQRKFSAKLGATIDQTANFMVKELLPCTLAINSGLTKADELIQQLVDDKVSLPTNYLYGKMTTAMHLRIVRFVSTLFELTDEEKKLMVAEYYRPWSES